MFLTTIGHGKRDGWSSIDGLEDFTFAFAEWLFNPGIRNYDKGYETTFRIDKLLYDYLFLKFYELGDYTKVESKKDYGKPFILNTPFGKIILERT